jgi:N-acetylglucosamine-6-phosphate deacetylase
MNDVGPYFDLQINGYAGVDFNSDDLSALALHEACERLAEDGVAGILATVISAPLELMERRLARLAALRAADPLIAERIAGIHIEGPFLNEQSGYVGAHPLAAMRLANTPDMRRLLDAARGLTRLVTLAPERDPKLATTRMLADSGVLVAAGHCDASLDELKAAIDAGLTVFTHLGNGCPQQLHRHDNIIQRVLSLRERLSICFIADGVHVSPPALGNYLRLVGPERAIVVTDAISAARLGPGRYPLGEQTVDVGPDLVCRSADGAHFVGSTATMPRMATLLADALGFSALEIRQMLWDNPRRLLAAGRS